MNESSDVRCRAACARRQNVIERSAVVLLVAALLSWALSLVLHTNGLDRPLVGSHNIFLRLFAAAEPIASAIVAAFAALLLIHLTRRAESAAGNAGQPISVNVSPKLSAAISVGVFVAAAAGTAFVLHGFGWSMDEYNSDFQAAVFSSGRRFAFVPAVWREYAPAITPGFVVWHPDSATWTSAYLPVYGLLRAAFTYMLGNAWLLNPLLAGLSIFVLADIVRRIWPNQRSQQLFAILALATSSQFLVTSMTAYSMPAHLLLNLLFISAFVRGTPASDLLAPLIGFVALGLHNPFPHALFVVPFLVAAIATRKWYVLTWWAFCYSAACLYWFGWMAFSNPLTEGSTRVSVFGLPTASQAVVQLMNFIMVLNWQAPLVSLLAIAGIAQVRHSKAIIRTIAASLLLTFCFYVLFPADQGHGWGYRYVYGVLGNIAILAAVGWVDIKQLLASADANRLFLTSLVLAALLQIPFRLEVARQRTRPFIAAEREMRNAGRPVVAFYADSIWYGRDLVRNSPTFLNRSIVVNLDRLTPAQRQEIFEQFSQRVVLFSTSDLVKLGLERTIRR